MPEKFQKTVNLSNRVNKHDDFFLPKTKKIGRLKKTSSYDKADQELVIKEMFSDDGENNLHKIVKARKNYNHLIVMVGIVILFIVLIVMFFVFFDKNKKEAITVVEKKSIWSAVILNDGSIYYGLIDDMNKNPIVLKNVYYDYDQIDKGAGEEKKDISNLRLVKKGKEAHGPDGSMIIYQAQIKYIEALKDDSKVLKAILDHENINK